MAASAAAAGLAATVAAIETAVAQDLGHRGVKHLQVAGDLLQAASAFLSSKKLLLLTGFPCVQAEPPTENDGISGTLALARAGVSMGKTVTIATDECNKDVIEAGLACKAYFPSDHAVHVAAFPARSGWGEAQESAFEATCMAHDHYIAVERAGANAQGTYCTMKGRSMDDLVAPLDAAFTQHAKVAGATTTGVGDGGNELGMGKVASAVEEHIPLGSTIACVGAADYLVAAGVSNWGAWGIIAAAQVMGRSQAEGATKDATAHPALPSVEEESALADALVAAGCCDGIRGIPSRSVDGLDFDVHAEKLTALRELASPAEA